MPSGSEAPSGCLVDLRVDLTVDTANARQIESELSSVLAKAQRSLTYCYNCF